MSSRRLILATRRQGLERVLSEGGFRPMTESQMSALLHAAGVWLGPRHYLESDETFLQIIPYILLVTDGGIVRYRRSKVGAEGRLHGKLSVGIGGHIDLADVLENDHGIALEATLIRAANREVDEELKGIRVVARQWVGLVMDEQSAVGRVHLGVVGVWRIHAGDFSPAEDAVIETELVPIKQLDRTDASWEAWSATLLPHIPAYLAAHSTATTSCLPEVPYVK